MNITVSVNFFLSLFVDTLKQFGRLKIWLVLLLYFLFHWLLLFSHYKFYSPAFYGIVHPWLNLIDSGNAVGFTHYPGHFLLLPMFFGWTKFYASILFEGTVLAVVALFFYNGFSGLPLKTGLSKRQFFHTWLHVTLAWLVINGLILLVNLTLPGLFGSLLEGSPRRVMMFQYLLQPGLYVIILALFFFAVPYIAINQTSAARGLMESLGYLWRHPITCLFLAGLVLIVPIVFSVILQNQATIVEKFHPEMVYWLLFAGLVADIFVNFFWMGTAVRFLIGRE